MINAILKLFNLKLIKLEEPSFLKDIEANTNTQVKTEEPEVVKDKDLEVVIPLRKMKVSTLTIYFENNFSTTWTVEDPIDSVKFPWADFYLWYVVKETPFFSFKHSTGETIFRRKDIIRIERTNPVVKEIEENK